MLLVDGAHQRGGRGQDLVDEDEDGLLRAELDALADDVDKLADGKVGGHKVLLLVDRRDVRLLDLLADDLRYTVSETCATKGLLASRDERCVPECGRRTSAGCAQLPPCASQTGARP